MELGTSSRVLGVWCNYDGPGCLWKDFRCLYDSMTANGVSRRVLRDSSRVNLKISAGRS